MAAFHMLDHRLGLVPREQVLNTISRMCPPVAAISSVSAALDTNLELPQLVLEHDLVVGRPVTGEVDDVRLVFVEGLEQVGGPHGPGGDQLDPVPVLGHADLLGDGTDLFVQPKLVLIQWVGGKYQNLELLR